MVKVASEYTRFNNRYDGVVPHRDAPDGAALQGFALPHGVEIFDTALVLPCDLKEHDWKVTGERLSTITKATQWAWGDWWRHGHHAYGKRAAIVAKGLVPYEFSTLMVYGTVAAAYKTLSRIKVLSFSHHQIVASLAPNVRQQWLQRAASHHWSVKQLSKMVDEDSRPRPWEENDAVEARRWANMTLKIAYAAQRDADTCRLTEHRGEFLTPEKIAELHQAFATVAEEWQHTLQSVTRFQEASAADPHPYRRRRRAIYPNERHWITDDDVADDSVIAAFSD
jgi:hypothetical protein